MLEDTLESPDTSCDCLLHNRSVLLAYQSLRVASICIIIMICWCDGSDDDDIVPSNPDLLTQIDEILQPCLSCHLDISCV